MGKLTTKSNKNIHRKNLKYTTLLSPFRNLNAHISVEGIERNKRNKHQWQRDYKNSIMLAKSLLLTTYMLLHVQPTELNVAASFGNGKKI